MGTRLQWFQALQIRNKAINRGALKSNEALDLLRLLAEPIEPSTRIIEILNFLATQHRNSLHSDERAALLETYRQYLKLVSNNIEIISQVYLLSQAGEWRMAQDLCIGESIAPQYLLHEDLQGVITTPPLAHPIDETSDSENSFNDLITYFESWPHRTRKAIGILLCILSGSNQELRDLSCQYLQDVDRYLECLQLRRQKDAEQKGAEFRKVAKRSTFHIILNRDSQRRVTSLAGTPLTVHILQSLDRLIVGQPKYIQQNEYELTFQAVPIEDADRLIAILKNTFQYIIKEIYDYEIIDFDSFWDKVNLTGIDIRIARHMLLDSGILSLRSQINPSLGSNSEIVNLIREYSELQKRKAKLEILGTGRLATEDINKHLMNNRDRIGELLCNNSEAQNLFLNAVKQKISNASYDEKSILFELFQNADDAYCELSSLGGGIIRHDIKIGYSHDDNELWISHWGRGINQDRYGNQVSENRGYDDDLLKMLLLNFSDKAEGVTGKFGLGFKSVFLASDKPRVASGTLGLEVIGAVYPRELTREEFDTIERCYLDGNADQGTAIVLPEVENSVAQNILSFFEDKALYLIAFSRWIKTITVSGAHGEMSYEWREERIKDPNSPNIYYGNGESYESSISALLLGDSTKRCLLGLDKSGFTPLPASCPTFWVTTPTRMFLDAGIAINAPFHPDIGRSQLDLNGGGFETNKALAQEIGHEFGQALIQLFQADETNHEELCRTLGLNHGTTQMDLWSNLWNILGTNLAARSTNDKGIELIHQIFWAEGCGMKRLFSECDALPTGLTNSNDFNCLTKPSKVRWAPTGILSQNSKFLADILNLPIFLEEKDHIKPGQIISQSIAETLENLGFNKFERLTLEQVLKLQFKDAKVTADIAKQIGDCIDQDFIGSLMEQEKNLVNAFLETLRFKSQDGEWKLAKELLIGEDEKSEQEEMLLSGFAPKSSLLGKDYQVSTLHFFYICRGQQSIDASEIVQWILKSKTDEGRRACILFLIHSKNRSHIIEDIKKAIKDAKEGHKHWLLSLERYRSSSKEKYGVSPYEFDALLYELGLLKEEDYSPSVSDQGGQPPQPVPPTVSPTQNEIEAILYRILQNWKNNKSRILRKYEESIYLREDLKLTRNNFSDSSDETKRRWLFLFMRAVLHSMGQTNFDQHKQFLRLCEDWEWIDVMALETPQESDWLNLLNKYFSRNGIGSNLPYYQWVRYYPAFYAISKWWHVYRDSLLESNNQRIRINSSGREIKSSIDLILNPRNNPIFQGTGIGHDAPPIGSILGMGSTFVIRELLRGNILTNSDLIPFAYVPAQNVREKLLKIGCKPFDEKAKPIQHSQHIHSFLKKHLKEDATFEGGYDLPILYHENA